MTGMRAFYFGVAALVCGTVAAQADGPRRDPYAYRPYGVAAYQPYDWSGFYVGGHAGWAFTSTDWTVVPLGSIEQTDNAFGGGAQIGLQKQWGNLVAGVEVSYTAFDTESTSRSSVGVVAAPITVVRSSEVSNLLLVTGRLGYAHENLLAYAKGGYASADVGFHLTLSAPPTVGSTSDREHGWTAGVGLEYAIRDNITVGAEYNFVHLNVDDHTLPPSTASVTDAGVDVQTIMARINFKFGERREAAPLK